MFSYQEKLLIIHTIDKEGDVTRTEIMSWCLNNHFELVECDEVAEDDCSDGDDSGGIVDIVGKARILEALKSHTWSTMELVEPPPLMSNKSQCNQVILFTFSRLGINSITTSICLKYFFL